MNSQDATFKVNLTIVENEAESKLRAQLKILHNAGNISLCLYELTSVQRAGGRQQIEKAAQIPKFVFQIADFSTIKVESETIIKLISTKFTAAFEFDEEMQADSFFDYFASKIHGHFSGNSLTIEKRRTKDDPVLFRSMIYLKPEGHSNVKLDSLISMMPDVISEEKIDESEDCSEEDYQKAVNQWTNVIRGQWINHKDLVGAVKRLQEDLKIECTDPYLLLTQTDQEIQDEGKRKRFKVLMSAMYMNWDKCCYKKGMIDYLNLIFVGEGESEAKTASNFMKFYCGFVYPVIEEPSKTRLKNVYKGVTEFFRNNKLAVSENGIMPANIFQTQYGIISSLFEDLPNIRGPFLENALIISPSNYEKYLESAVISMSQHEGSNIDQVVFLRTLGKTYNYLIGSKSRD